MGESTGRSDSQATELVEVQDMEQLADALEARGWWDGLPVVPPTTERVQAMLAVSGGDSDASLGRMPPKYGTVTLRGIACNAVLAGCRPEYFPTVVASVVAALQPDLNLNGLQATTHPCAVLVVASGPNSRAIGMNSGINAFGPGNRANATIGRALRLCLLSIGGGHPGDGDMATMGSPAKYSYCIAENLEESPWGSVAEYNGFSPSDSTVTLFGAEAPQNVNDHESKSGLGILRMIAGTMRSTGANNPYYRHGQVLIVLSPEHARTIADSGYSRKEVSAFLWAESRIPIGYFSEEGIRQRLQTRFPREFTQYGVHTTVPVVHDPSNVLVCVAGGPGKHSMFVPTFGGTRAVTQAVRV